MLKRSDGHAPPELRILFPGFCGFFIHFYHTVFGRAASVQIAPDGPMFLLHIQQKQPVK
jgi:hypothetical protein